MTIFKVLCLIGCVLLSSGYARQQQARHGSRFRHDYGFHRYKHILKRHESGNGNPRYEGSTQRASTGVSEVRAKGNDNYSCLIILVTYEMNVFKSITTGSNSSYSNTRSIRNYSYWTF